MLDITEIHVISVGLSGLEPPTSRLSGVRSNRLSYKPGVKPVPLYLPSSFFLPAVSVSFRQHFRFSCPPGPFFNESGSHLLSHAVSSIVPSAVWVLTVVFGMGTGVSP